MLVRVNVGGNEMKKKQVIEFLDMIEKNKRERLQLAVAAKKQHLEKKRPKLQVMEIEG